MEPNAETESEDDLSMTSSSRKVVFKISTEERLTLPADKNQNLERFAAIKSTIPVVKVEGEPFVINTNPLPYPVNASRSASSGTIDEAHQKLLNSYLKGDYGGGDENAKYVTPPYNCTSISIAIAFVS